MPYSVLATDYDGTLATDGHVHQNTLAALENLRSFGYKLILVTGRQLDDLQQVFTQVNLFDCVVAENGALLYFPSQRQEQLLGSPPPVVFIEALQKHQVQPLSFGRVIVATWHPQETIVQKIIHELQLELQVILNKGAVMILPSGVDKATGLATALDEMQISFSDVVGVGDAENDYAFLSICAYSVAVANALPTLKERVDFVTNGSRGDGVVELIKQLISSRV